jgi:Family of unknown function (DUF5995)
MARAQALTGEDGGPAQRRERMGALVEELRRRADDLEAQRDGRCVFTRTYARLTLRLARCLEDGRIDDPEWVTALAEAFAARYVAALEGRSGSRAWEEVFAAITRARPRTSVLEDLVFAMTAHIVRDLPHALHDVDFLAPGPSRVHDFHAVNAVMGEALEEIQADISQRYAPGLKALDRLSKRYDEILTNYGVRMSRGLAWYNAMRLADPTSRPAAERSIEESSIVFMRRVLSPRLWSVGVAFRTMRVLSSFGRRWPAAEA